MKNIIEALEKLLLNEEINKENLDVEHLKTVIEQLENKYSK